MSESASTFTLKVECRLTTLVVGEVNLLQRSARFVEVELLVQVPIADCAFNAKRVVNFHSPIPSIRVFFSKQKPFMVGLVWTEHTGRSWNFMRNTKRLQPLHAIGSGHHLVAERELGF